MLLVNACDESMVAQVMLHVKFRSTQHLVRLEQDQVLGSNGNPQLAPLNDQSELIMCPPGSGESLEQLVHLN